MQRVKLAEIDALAALRHGHDCERFDHHRPAVYAVLHHAVTCTSCHFMRVCLDGARHSPWLLSFPGVFAPRGLLGGSSSEITVCLYTLWHAGFQRFVIAYALLKGAGFDRRLRRVSASVAILSCFVGTAAVISAATYLLVTTRSICQAS